MKMPHQILIVAAGVLCLPAYTCGLRVTQNFRVSRREQYIHWQTAQIEEIERLGGEPASLAYDEHGQIEGAIFTLPASSPNQKRFTEAAHLMASQAGQRFRLKRVGQRWDASFPGH